MYQKKWKQWRLSFFDMFPGSEIQIQRVDLKENPRNKRRGFAVYIHEITKVWQCPGKPVNLPRG